MYYCGQTAGWIKTALDMEVGLSPADCVRWGPSTPPKKGQSPQFSAHVYCGQTAAWIKMPFGTKVGLGSDDIVLDGTQFPSPKKGRPPPHYRPMSIVARRLDGAAHVAWRWVLVQLATLCYLGTQLPSPNKAAETPSFRPIFIVAKQLDASRCHLVCSLTPGNFVFDGDPVTPEKNDTPTTPNFGTSNVARWIKMPLGTEVTAQATLC